MHAGKNPGCHAEYYYCYSLRKKERKKKEGKKHVVSFIFLCAKPENLNLKTKNLWTPPLFSICSFVHLQPAELQCAVGVNVAVWRTGRQTEGQSAGQGRSSLSYVGMVGVIATTGQRIFVKKRISA
jgi:hypothetical protein